MTCERCGSECHHRSLTLDLSGAGARRIFFCSDGCEAKWIRTEYLRGRGWLNRIFTTARGRAHKAAHLALTTAEQP